MIYVQNTGDLLVASLMPPTPLRPCWHHKKVPKIMKSDVKWLPDAARQHTGAQSGHKGLKKLSGGVSTTWGGSQKGTHGSQSGSQGLPNATVRHPKIASRGAPERVWEKNGPRLGFGFSLERANMRSIHAGGVESRFCCLHFLHQMGGPRTPKYFKMSPKWCHFCVLWRLHGLW